MSRHNPEENAMERESILYFIYWFFFFKKESRWQKEVISAAYRLSASKEDILNCEPCS